MPRSYPYDHFTVTKQGEPPVERGDGRARAARGAGPHEQPVRYGKRFAETEELSQVRQMTHQLEELAGVEEPKISRPREPQAAAGRVDHAFQVGQRSRPERLDRGPPIGAMPAGAPPPQEGGVFRELVGVGGQQLRLLRHSVRDGVAAGYRLATLPLQVVRLAARRMALRLSPWHQPG